MVSAALAEALVSPTHTLATLFTSTSSFPQTVSHYFSNLFQSQSAFHQIPSLNVLHPPLSFPHNSLVAFRAMVQDTSPSPQIYLAKLPNNNPGGWGITYPQDLSPINHDDLGQCTVLWATSVPGESLWCTQQTTNPYQENTNAISHKPTHPHKFPFPEKSHIGVQVKIYDPSLADGLKPSDLCTFVGILTSEPLHTQDLESPAETDDNTVPTLHVLFTRPTPPTIIPRTFPASSIPDQLHKTRDELLTWIAEEGLGGDKVAAEWLLLSAIARTQSRTPPIYPPSLTLSSFPAPSDVSASPTIHHILSLILPITNILPLSLDTLNTTSFCPESKNEDLHSGWLQVPHGTLYLLTESGITEGNVLEKGIQNLRAAQGVMTGQTVDYVFPFSRFTFPTDVSFVVLTEGKKSAFFQTSVNITLKSDGGNGYDLYKPLENVRLPDNAVLDQWRSLVGGSKIGTVTINDETAQYIQEDFVSERKATTSRDSAITSDDLIHRMITARLLALSYHETSVTKEVWEKTKALEAKRKSRA